MSRADDGRGTRLDQGARTGTVPHPPGDPSPADPGSAVASLADPGPADHGPAVAYPAVPVGALLALLAVAEAAVRAGVTGASAQFALVLCLLALSTTLPPAFLRPVGAAVAVTLVAVLSLALFRTLTVAGLCAELIVLYRLGSDRAEADGRPTGRTAVGAAGRTTGRAIAGAAGGWSRRGAQLSAVGLTVPFLVLALVLVLAVPRPAGAETAVLTVLLAALAPAAAWAGIAGRARGEASMHSAAREAVAGTLLEHSARAERARIARELHDVVAHHVSMVAVQAETARLTTPGMPAAGAQRLSAIGDTARAALTEMRRLLGVLREDAGTEAVERQPQPGLRQLADLLDTARDASGAGARLILRGPPVALDPGVELAAFRIVQEALTNARRHAPGAAVDVELRYTGDALRLRIRDNGPGTSAAPQAGGLGLLGMGERATAVGGRLRTGSASGSGFLVEAVLPAQAEESR